MSDIERKKEIRLRSTVITRAAGEESRKVEGYALLFDVESDGLDFTEIIAKGAVTEDTIKRSNVFCLLNHNESRGILARSKEGDGTLALSVDDKGLFFSFDAPHTALGDEVLEYLTRGDVDSCSFAFTVEKDEWLNPSSGEGGEYKRVIREIHKLYDVSIVYDAAYSKTEVDRRGLDSFKSAKEDILKREKEKEINNYYSEIEEKFNLN